MLKKALIANALSCLLFGILFLAKTDAAYTFIGEPPVMALRILGIGLIINGVHLGYVSSQKQPSRNVIFYFIIGDIIWVLVTLVLLAMGLWITTSLGIIFAIWIAVFVGLCGALQWCFAPVN